jgi:hypothetical protein
MEVLRTSSAGRAVERLDRPARRAYDAAVAELRGRGCAAGGYRLLAVDGDDYPLCCRYFYRQWRMHLAFRGLDAVVILSVEEHTKAHNPHETLAEIFPGLSATGRRRSQKPPCCEENGDPPEMSGEVRAFLQSLVD